MKNKFFGLGMLVLVFGLVSAGNAFSQEVNDSDNIFESGERFVFQNGEGSIERFMFLKLNNEMLLVVITRVDRDFNIIEGFNLWDFDGTSYYYDIPGYAGGGSINHVHDDVYKVTSRKGRESEYTRMIKAPEGFWSDAFLNTGN